MSELWLIGEAPTRANGLPFTGRAGEKLSQYLGRDLERSFRLANVLTEWPGRSEGGKGAKFPRQLAREGVEKLFAELMPSDWVIVVGGRNASNAWRLKGLTGPYRWEMLGAVSTLNVPKRLARTLVSWIPHPSPVNQTWNDPDNIVTLRRFIDDTIRHRQELGYRRHEAGPQGS